MLNWLEFKNVMLPKYVNEKEKLNKFNFLEAAGLLARRMSEKTFILVPIFFNATILSFFRTNRGTK